MYIWAINVNMITEENLYAILNEQKEWRQDNRIVQREVNIPVHPNRIIVITGIRRCGKSTLLKQFLRDTGNALYLNFEDPRLVNFELSDFIKVEKIAGILKSKTFLLDEIQNITGWERFARAAYDKGLHLYLTGSNTGMLSKELGTRLTGRYKSIELFPFSYKEYLDFTLSNASKETFSAYLKQGGFPDYLRESESEYLHTLLKDIITRDIAIRRGIRNEQQLVRLAVFLISNIGKPFSYNNITSVLEIKSVRTTIDYCDFLRESYLFDFIPRYSQSIRKQQANAKKVYCIDTGLARTNSLSFSEDQGRMLENAVFLHLRISGMEISYYNDNKTECDFLVKVNGRIDAAYQVCWHLHEDNTKRELAGIKNALETTGCKNGAIITFNQEDKLDGIRLIPAWKWLYTDSYAG